MQHRPLHEPVGYSVLACFVEVEQEVFVIDAGSSIEV